MAGAGDVELQGQRRHHWLAMLFAAGWCSACTGAMDALPRPPPRRGGVIDMNASAHRGSILDASGHYLVTSTVPASASRRAARAVGARRTDPVLAGLLGRPEEVAAVTANEATEYAILATASPTEGDGVQALRRTPCGSRRFGRAYPDGKLASSVLGFRMTLKDNEAQYGLLQAEQPGRARAASATCGATDLVNEGVSSPPKSVVSAHPGSQHPAPRGEIWPPPSRSSRPWTGRSSLTPHRRDLAMADYPGTRRYWVVAGSRRT